MKSIHESLTALRNGDNAPEGSGDYWSETDLNELERLFWDGIGMSEIAIYMQRTEVAIYQQLLKLRVLAHQCVPRIRRERPVCRGCLCPTCSNPNCEYRGKEHPNVRGL